ncbi:hypothetical protein SUNI508_05725 [Seiridium unicorne]|uniref:DUF7587 domain-containing protein n=1 Tax=Seiridium unicorne TaxID=138068 RepID=A0ABR2V3J8_9PEZI
MAFGSSSSSSMEFLRPDRYAPPEDDDSLLDDLSSVDYMSDSVSGDEVPPIPVDLRDDYQQELPECPGGCCDWQKPGHPINAELIQESAEAGKGGPPKKRDDGGRPGGTPTAPPSGVSAVRRNARLEEGRTPVPRFLFRGFWKESGGGDHRLNQVDRILPHAYINGHAPSIELRGPARDLPNFGTLVKAHLVGKTDIISPFSSWTQSLQIALYFSSRSTVANYYKTSRIAIIDTTLLPAESELFSVLQLRDEGVHKHHFAWEYLAFGPIFGDCFYSVPSSEVHALLGPPRALNYYELEERHVAEAKEVAQIFRAPAWIQWGESADVVIYVTTIVVCSWFTLTMNDVPKPVPRILKQNEKHTLMNALQAEVADGQGRFSQGTGVRLGSTRPQDGWVGFQWFYEALTMFV